MKIGFSLVGTNLREITNHLLGPSPRRRSRNLSGDDIIMRIEVDITSVLANGLYEYMDASDVEKKA